MMTVCSVTLVLVTTYVVLVSSDQQTCLNMHQFSNTYSTMESGIRALEAQVKVLKTQLDSTILSACQHMGSDVDPYRFNLTYCDFEDGRNCYFSPETGSGWSVVTAGNDHTFLTTTARVIPKYLSKLDIHRTNIEGHSFRSYSTYKSTSGLFDRSPNYCIRFFLKSTSASYKFKVYLKEDQGLGYPIYEATPAPLTWSLVEITPDPEYLTKPFKLTFEGQSGGYTFVDDLMVYDKPCNTEGIRSPICHGKEVVIEGKKHCYTFHIQPLAYYDAIRYCKKAWPLAHLVSVTLSTIQNYIVNWIHNSSELEQTGNYGFWTSGNDEVRENKFFWASNTEPIPFNYTSWHSLQPNNIGGNQDCVLLQYNTDNYNWGDVACTERHPFICESEYPV